MRVLIIGAGMAGLAADYTLRENGQHNNIILEARHRVGGRIHTDRHFAHFPVEFGAEFLHGERNPLWDWVDELRLGTIHWPKAEDSMVRLESGKWFNMIQARQFDLDFEFTRSWNFKPLPPFPEENFADYLIRIGCNKPTLNYVRRSFANAIGDDPQHLSAEAVLNELFPPTDYGKQDHRLNQGYDQLLKPFTRRAEIYFNAVVREIIWDEEPLIAITENNNSYQADRIIITLPVGVLDRDIVGFTPALPAIKLNALEYLKMGTVLKMIYRYDMHFPYSELAAVYSAQNPPMWWSPSYDRRTTYPVWTAFATGDWARELLALGEEGALNKGQETLKNELGRPPMPIYSRKLVNWSNDPYAYGGYSVVMPGGDEARRQLAQPTHKRLYWAGEATAPDHEAATVHGAYLSGIRAATELLQDLNAE